MSVKVKVCGITTAEDALAAIGFGADALGFIFYSKSARYITPERAEAIIKVLPPFVTTVGVFVDASTKEINKTVSTSKISTAQLHGKESPEECAGVTGARVIKAFRVAAANDLAVINRYSVAANLLDTFVKGTHGGTGKTFDWGLAKEAKAQQPNTPLILSGGLTPENIDKAIQTVRPYAVDVSSGVEISPGVKDKKLMQAFIKIAKLT